MFDRFGGEYSGIDEYAAARDPATGKARQRQRVHDRFPVNLYCGLATRLPIDAASKSLGDEHPLQLARI